MTPLDLRQQRVQTVMGGYHRGEVQAFLLEVADDYENALRENDQLHLDVAKLDAVLGEHRGPHATGLGISAGAWSAAAPTRTA